MSWTRAQFEALAFAAQADPRSLIERAFKITTKGLAGQQPVQLLKFNRLQQKIHDALMAQRAAGKPQRGIVLKARQGGASTYGCGRLAAGTLTLPYSNSLVISHLEESTVKLFKKCQFIYDNLPPYLQPKRMVSRREELVVDAMPCVDGEVQLHASLAVATAGGGELWRGLTLQNVWLSELAFYYQHADPVLLGVLQSVPDTPQTMVVIESTANGMGNVFHEEWRRAESGESEFVPIFIGWWEIEEYQMPVPEGFDPTPEERDLQRALGLTNEQLQWRRYTLYTKCRGSEDKFNQEHPYSPAVAFIATGRPAFPVRVLQEMYEHARRQRFQAGEWTVAENRFVTGGGQYGRFRVFEEPQKSHEYVIAADPSSGQEDGDPCCIQVLNRTTERMVATWHGHLEPEYLAHVMIGIGRWYNHGWLAPEINNGHGLSMIGVIRQAQYPRIYVWTRVDKIRHQNTNFYGWETSWKSRPLLIDSLRFALQERLVYVCDPDTIQELTEFQYFDGRRAEGINHDDRAMAAMIAWRVHLEMPLDGTGQRPRQQEPEPEAPEVVTWPNAMTKEAWDAVDQDVARMQRQERTGFLEEVDLEDPGDEATGSWGFEPDWQW